MTRVLSMHVEALNVAEVVLQLPRSSGVQLRGTLSLCACRAT